VRPWPQSRVPLCRVGPVIHFDGEDGQFRADEVAEAAVHAGLLLIRGDYRVVIAPGIGVFGIGEDVLRAIAHTEAALLAALWNNVNLTAW